MRREGSLAETAPAACSQAGAHTVTAENVMYILGRTHAVEEGEGRGKVTRERKI